MMLILLKVVLVIRTVMLPVMVGEWDYPVSLQVAGWMPIIPTVYARSKTKSLRDAS